MTRKEVLVKPFAWLMPVAVALIASGITSFVSSPVSRIDRLETRLQTLEISKASSDAQMQSLKDALTEIKAQQVLVADKIDSLRNELISQRRK